MKYGIYRTGSTFDTPTHRVTKGTNWWDQYCWKQFFFGVRLVVVMAIHDIYMYDLQQANGLDERFNQILHNMLVKYLDEKEGVVG